MGLRKTLYELVHKQPYGTDEIVSIKDIEIPKRFKKHYPNQWKMDRALEFYNKHGYVDQPISVVKVAGTGICKHFTIKYLLVDEYTRYLTIVNKDGKQVPVRYIEILQ